MEDRSLATEEMVARYRVEMDGARERARLDMNLWLKRLVESGLSPGAMEEYVCAFAKRIVRVTGHWRRCDVPPFNQRPWNEHNGALASAEVLAMSGDELQALMKAVSKENAK